MRSIHLVNAEMLAKPVPYEGSGGKSTSLPFAPARGCVHSLARGPCLPSSKGITPTSASAVLSPSLSESDPPASL